MKTFQTALISTVAALAFIPALAEAQTSLSSLTAPTAPNSINAGGNYEQSWQWGSLTAGPALFLNASNQTATNGQIVLEVQAAGSNNTSGVTSYATEIINGHAGTNSTNYGLYSVANNGTINNYGIYGVINNVLQTPNAGDAGVWGDALGTTGATYGVKGTNSSSAGYAGYFNNTAGGYAAAFMGGDVGIGTATPNTTLQVNGGVQITGSGWPSTGTGLTLLYDGTYGTIQSSNRAGSTTLEPLLLEGSYTDIYNGNLGIANTSPAYLLHVGSSSASGTVAEFQNSSGACTLTPTASTMTPSCTSDMRLKKDIEDSDSALPWLDGMRIRDFTIKATGERRTGVIAQELKETNPDMVHKNAEGFYAVDEPNPWMVVKTIQELHAQLSDDEAQIPLLQVRAEADEARLADDEKTIAAMKAKLGM